MSAVRNAALFASASTPKPATETIEDTEFGTIRLRRNANAKHVRLRMDSTGSVSITLPRFASVKHAASLLESSRASIRKWREKHARNTVVFTSGDKVGHSHTIHFSQVDQTKISVTIKDLDIQVRLPLGKRADGPAVQRTVRPYIMKALQKEARAYLPRRLKYLAEQCGFTYARTRFGTQKGRWGSCSSTGTISLNVALMMLSHELIDYVLIHELCHTKQMNHSPNFWKLVEQCLPDYKERRRAIKKYQPFV